MKGYNRKHRFGLGWLSLLIIVALLTPMFSAIALAEDVEEYYEEQVFEMQEDDYEEPEEDYVETEDVDDEPEDEPEEEPAKPEEEEEPSEEEKPSDEEKKSDGETSDEEVKKDEEGKSDGDKKKDDADKPSEEAKETDVDGEEDEEIAGDALEADEAVYADVFIEEFYFDNLEDEFEVIQKPDTVDAFIDDELPKTGTALLTNGDEVEDFPVVWTCENESEFTQSDYGHFVFASEPDTSKSLGKRYKLNEEKADEESD